MKKILNSAWGQGIYQGILYGIELLFVFSLAVDLSAFYMGVTSGWVSLFTYMVMLGALVFGLLLNQLVKQRMSGDIQKRAIWIRLIIYACVSVYTDYRLGAFLLLINLVLLFVKRRIDIPDLIALFFALVVVCYGYQQAWVGLAECILLVLGESGIFIRITDRDTSLIKGKGYDLKSLWKIDQTQVHYLVILILLKSVIYGCLVLALGIFEVALVHIANEGEIFNASRIFPYWIILFIVQFVASYLYQKTSRKAMEKDSDEDEEVRLFHASLITERISFSIVMCISGIVMAKSSFLLCCYFILSCISENILLLLIENRERVSWIFLRNIRTFLIRLFLVGNIVIVQSLYDGVFVDNSVVLISALLFYGFVLCMDTWKKDDPLLENLLDQEEE